MSRRQPPTFAQHKRLPTHCVPLNMRTTSMPHARLPLPSRRDASSTTRPGCSFARRVRGHAKLICGTLLRSIARSLRRCIEHQTEHEMTRLQKRSKCCATYHAQLREHTTTGIVLAPNLHLLKEQQLTTKARQYMDHSLMIARMPQPPPLGKGDTRLSCRLMRRTHRMSQMVILYRTMRIRSMLQFAWYATKRNVET